MIPDFESSDERTQWIIDHADLWTAVRFHGRGKYERHEFPDRASAENAAKRMAEASGGRYMIYACHEVYDSFVTAVAAGEK